MTKLIFVVAIAGVSCKGREKEPAQKPSEPPAPVAAPAPPPPPPPAARPTPITGFAKPAQIDLPDGFTLGVREEVDGEGSAITATRGGLTLELVYTVGKKDPVIAEYKKGMAIGGKPSWKREETDDGGWLLVFEQAGKTSVSVYRKAAHGFCSADEVAPAQVDEVIAICRTLRPI